MPQHKWPPGNSARFTFVAWLSLSGCRPERTHSTEAALAIRAVLTVGSHTIIALLRAFCFPDDPNFTTFHCALKRNLWSFLNTNKKLQTS